MVTEIQIPSIILPTVWTTGLETEAVNDLVEHTSIEFPVEYIQEKTVMITAIESIAAGVPGNLWCWIELSPYLTITTAAYWAAIGGGGGAIAPTVPVIIAATGVNLTTHSILLPWAIHSTYARLVVQTPVSATPLTAFWTIQAQFSGKTP